MRSALVLVALVACSGSATERLEAGSQFPVSIDAPSKWTPLSAEQRVRLEAAIRRSDPEAVVVVNGRRPNVNSIEGAVIAIAVDHPSSYTAGVSLDQVVANAEQRLGAASVPSTFEIVERGERHADVLFTIGESGELRNLTRMFFSHDRLRERGCQCIGGPDCTARCKLPAVPER